ncbi:MAG: M23 family metallopeptidase [Vampirovibrionales bacterium]|nr:M23 family metallopeptidase [Vampirovibrionales bacterium]
MTQRTWTPFQTTARSIANRDTPMLRCARLQKPLLQTVALLGLTAFSVVLTNLALLESHQPSARLMAHKPLASTSEAVFVAPVNPMRVSTGGLFVAPLTASERRIYQNSVAVLPQMIQLQIGTASPQTHQKKKNARRYLTAFSGLMTPVSRFTFSSPYGMRHGRMHQGVDFAAPVGTPIHAAADGVVLSIGWDGGYGQSVLIEHDGRLVTRYAHCSALHVRKGQRVIQGQHIANVGNTGSSSGAHLHLEVIEAGRHRNPMSRLKPFNTVIARQAGRFSKSG